MQCYIVGTTKISKIQFKCCILTELKAAPRRRTDFKLVKGCLQVDQDSGYLEAKMLLREKVWRPYRTSYAYLKKINEWPITWTGNKKALDKFSVFLTITMLTFQ